MGRKGVSDPTRFLSQPLSHLYYSATGHGLTPDHLKRPSSLGPHPFHELWPRPFSSAPLIGPVLWSRTRRRKCFGFLPGPRRAQRLDRRGRNGRISGQPRVKHRSRHPPGQTRQLRLVPEVFLPLGPPPSRKTRVRATGFSQSGAPRGKS